jgi:integrase
MAISYYVSENGETLWKVYVNVRNKTRAAIRAQRRLAGCKNQREAEREETRLVRECEREIMQKENQGDSWEAVVDAWAEYIVKEASLHLSETTRLDYVAAIRNHTSLWNAQSAASITKLNVKECLNQMKVSGGSHGLQKRMRGLINQVFTFGIDNGLIKGLDRSPTIGVQLEKPVEKKPEILTTSEIRKLLVEGRKYKHPWYPVWVLALLTGMRNGELFALEWSDVDWNNRTISVNKSHNNRLKVIKSTKNGHWRTVPISSELLSFLQKVKVETGGTPYVLPRFRQWTRGLQAAELRKFCLGVNLPSIKFHALRACFATQLLQNGVPAIMIQKICDWKDLKTMQRYIRMAGIEVGGATETLKLLGAAALDSSGLVDTTAVAGKIFGSEGEIL